MSHKRVSVYVTACAIVIAHVGIAFADQAVPEIPERGVEPQLGSYVPLDLELVDETGKLVTIGSLIDRPTIISLVYYRCQAVCRPLLTETSTVIGKLGKMDLVPGKDYNLITISFDDTDSPAGSARLKKEYYATLPNGFPSEAWTFLTGDEASIRKFTNAVGFGFSKQGEDFAHPSTLIVLAKDGKITRYLYAQAPIRRLQSSEVTGYLPADVKLAILEASRGQVGSTVARILKFCFAYDPEGQGYVLSLTRVVGLSTLLGVAGMAIALNAGKRRKKVGNNV